MSKYYFWAIILTCQLLSAQNPNKIVLAKVDVVGNTNTSKNTIIFTSGLREGQLVNPTDFPRAIKRLWQLGLFQDIQIEYEKETEDGLFLVIKVIENYILGDIKYEGNRKIKESKFEEELGLTRGQRLKPNTLHITKNLIEKLYAEKGYLNVEVRPSLLVPDNKIEINVSKNRELVRDIVFNISENKKTKIKIPAGTQSGKQLRLKGKGSDGGHNGLKDIEAQLNTPYYSRLRVGIKSDQTTYNQVDFVLGKFTASEGELISKTLPRCADLILSFVLLGLEKTMNKFNGKLPKATS